MYRIIVAINTFHVIFKALIFQILSVSIYHDNLTKSMYLYIIKVLVNINFAFFVILHFHLKFNALHLIIPNLK